MEKKESKKGVESPANSREGTIKNAGGMPPTWKPDEIWKENTPPDRMAEDSTDTIGSE